MWLYIVPLRPKNKEIVIDRLAVKWDHSPLSECQSEQGGWGQAKSLKDDAVLRYVGQDFNPYRFWRR